MYVCDFPNGGKKGNNIGKGGENMSKVFEDQTYRKLNISSGKIKEISVTPKMKDGKLILNRENKNHRYIMDDD